MIRPSTLIALLIALLVLGAAPLRADEGENETSEAAKLFRDAWWAETSSGALDKAVAGYTKAAAAKGSDKIRARALYRKAVVLQRMGKTADGVRALESLAKQFPRETELLAKAKQRLDEWTAEDLRTSFSDWYKRYQYSAAFQAKIVDLVLKLGGSDQGAGIAARRELLTIGEPALNALREHANSPNYHLRYTAIELILEIGTLPAPDVLWTGAQWHRKYEFWKLLAAATPAEREAYARAAAERKGDFRSAWIAAFLAGPEAVLDVVAKETSDTTSVTSVFLGHFLRKSPGEAFYAKLRKMATDEGVHSSIRKYIAGRLLSTWSKARTRQQDDPTGLMPAEIVRWISHKALRDTVLPYLRSGSIPSTDAWRSPAELALSNDASPTEKRDYLTAMLGQLRIVPVGTDVEVAIKALAQYLSAQSLNTLSTTQLGEGSQLQGTSTVPWAVMVKAVGRARGPSVRSAPRHWYQNQRERPEAFEALLEWIATGADLGLRQEAMSTAAFEIRDRPQRLTTQLVDLKTRRELRDKLFSSLSSNGTLEDLEWDRESLIRLVETARDSERYARNSRISFTVRLRESQLHVSTRFSQQDARVLARLLNTTRTRQLLFEGAFAEPERFVPSLWDLFGSLWSRAKENQDWVLAQLTKRWKDWTPAQRGPGLKLFVTERLVGKASDALTAFLRTVLAQGDLDASTRFFVVGRMPKLTLADLKTIYDFRDSKQRKQAAAIMGRVSKLTLADVQSMYDFKDPKEVDLATQFLGRLPVNEAVYDAFKPALRPEGARAKRVYDHFKSGPDSRAHDLVRKLLRHKGTWRLVESLLNRRATAKDLPLWIEMLTHEESWTRIAAAKALGRLYNQDAIKALAKAVDDPDPNVRDAVLASLERIDKTEKQKDRWREYAKDR